MCTYMSGGAVLHFSQRCVKASKHPRAAPALHGQKPGDWIAPSFSCGTWSQYVELDPHSCS